MAPRHREMTRSCGRTKRLRKSGTFPKPSAFSGIPDQRRRGRRQLALRHDSSIGPIEEITKRLWRALQHLKLERLAAGIPSRFAKQAIGLTTILCPQTSTLPFARFCLRAPAHRRMALFSPQAGNLLSNPRLSQSSPPAVRPRL